MYSFYDKYIISSQRQLSSAVLSLSCLEIEGRHINSLSFKKPVHILIEQLYINRFKALKIKASVRILRAKLPVHIVVIQT